VAPLAVLPRRGPAENTEVCDAAALALLRRRPNVLARGEWLGLCRGGGRDSGRRGHRWIGVRFFAPRQAGSCTPHLSTPAAADARFGPSVHDRAFPRTHMPVKHTRSGRAVRDGRLGTLGPHIAIGNRLFMNLWLKPLSALAIPRSRRTRLPSANTSISSLAIRHDNCGDKTNH